MEFIHAIFLGILEGFTEFLPISSTGHLILASEFLGIAQDNFHKSFEIIIQLGSILAVVFLFWHRLVTQSGLWIKLAIAFLPSGILGFLFYKHIKSFFAPSTVAYALIIGGIVFIAIELLHKDKQYKINAMEQLSYKEVVLIGFFQALAMIPGTSRSGSTIIGGLLLGLNRKVATEFSFLLAIPTMLIATTYDIYKNAHVFTPDNVLILIAGFVSAFLFALIAIRGFLHFISKFSFIPFGLYRIFVGVGFLYFMGIL